MRGKSRKELDAVHHSRPYHLRDVPTSPEPGSCDLFKLTDDFYDEANADAQATVGDDIASTPKISAERKITSYEDLEGERSWFQFHIRFPGVQYPFLDVTSRHALGRDIRRPSASTGRSCRRLQWLES